MEVGGTRGAGGASAGLSESIQVEREPRCTADVTRASSSESTRAATHVSDVLLTLTLRQQAVESAVASHVAPWTPTSSSLQSLRSPERRLRRPAGRRRRRTFARSVPRRRCLCVQCADLPLVVGRGRGRGARATCGGSEGRRPGGEESGETRRKTRIEEGGQEGSQARSKAGGEEGSSSSASSSGGGSGAAPAVAPAAAGGPDDGGGGAAPGGGGARATAEGLQRRASWAFTRTSARRPTRTNPRYRRCPDTNRYPQHLGCFATAEEAALVRAGGTPPGEYRLTGRLVSKIA